jgi:D-alanine-D-alanine ligase-like ATP-grasp enzyme
MNIDLSKIHFNSALLAKEMVKRWMELKFIWNTNLIEAEFDWHVEIIDETEISIMPSTYRTIFDDKFKTKLILNDKWFSTVKWCAFSPVESDKALDYVKKELTYPVVVKSVTWTHGYQVKMNIYNDDEFIKNFEKLAKYTSFQIDILVEKQVFFNEFRITVTKNWFIAWANRQGANVLWDWVKNLKELIDDVNYNRINFRTTCLCEIRVDDEVHKYLNLKWITLDYIPKNWERVFLRSNSNISTWWDCIDVSDFICDEFKALAFKLLNDFPGLPYIWIDLLTTDISNFWEYYICELNPSPWISIHTHPWVWEFRDLPKFIIDMLFPETINFKKKDDYNRFILNKNFKTIQELWEHFVKNYPKNYYYRPLQIELELTNKCNFRCNGCAIIDDIEKWEYWLDKEFIIKFLNDAKWTWIYSYTITWWEPFLRFDDMCNIIKNVDLDCHKIQTNWSFFDSDIKANLYLKKLSESWFWKNNKYLKPSIRISFWISNPEQENYWNKIIYSSKNFYKYFDKETTTLWFVVSDFVENIKNTSENFIHDFEEKVWIPFDNDKYYIRSIYIQPEAKKLWKIDDSYNLNIRDYIKSIDESWSCFGINESIPWPKILIKANWDVYSCTCFSQVFLVWNIKNNTIHEIIEKVNNHEIIKIISEKWLMWFLEYAEEFSPWIWNKKIPNNLTQCNVCRIIKDAVKKG